MSEEKESSGRGGQKGWGSRGLREQRSDMTWLHAEGRTLAVCGEWMNRVVRLDQRLLLDISKEVGCAGLQP